MWGCLEGKSKEITTMTANMIVEELIESSLESTLEEVHDGSTPEFHTTEIPSQMSTDIIIPALAVQIIDDDTNGKLQACPLTLQWDMVAMAKENCSLTNT